MARAVESGDSFIQAQSIARLGSRSLPDSNFLKGFDEAILPFARGEATRFLSPSKTLEYMAAHKPIVSVPLPDVVALYGEVVRFASDSDAFVATVEAALGEGTREREARIVREAALLGRYAWDRLAGEMAALIADRRDADAPSRWAMRSLAVASGYSAALVVARPVGGVALFDAPDPLTAASFHAPHASA